MEIQAYGDMDFTVCKVENLDKVDMGKPFTFLAVTDEEISLVCESHSVPQNTSAIEGGWKMLKICGVLEFSLIGVLARISQVLAAAQISIFAVSTFQTDYIFIKKESLDKGLDALRQAGYEIIMAYN